MEYGCTECNTVPLKHLQADGANSIFNVGYGRGATVREVINIVKQVSGVDFTVLESPRRPGNPSKLVAHAERIRTLDWHLRHDSLETIVRDTLNWEQKLTGLANDIS